MNELLKTNEETIIDFILNYNGKFTEKLLPFMIEQNYVSLDSFFTATKYIYTNLLNPERVRNIGTRSRINLDRDLLSFSTSFSPSFQALKI